MLVDTNSLTLTHCPPARSEDCVFTIVIHMSTYLQLELMRSVQLAAIVHPAYFISKLKGGFFEHYCKVLPHSFHRQQGETT